MIAFFKGFGQLIVSETKAPFTRERNGTERCGTVPENKEIFAGVHTRTTRNVPFRSEKWTALKSEP